jgi:hypothetical protein
MPQTNLSEKYFLFFRKIFIALILFSSFLPLSANAQVHHFSNPKIKVEVSKDFLKVYSSGLPDHKSERVNPNTPIGQKFVFKIPRVPKFAKSPAQVPSRGPIGIAVNGVVFFGPEDKQGKLAIENHGLDSCRGHPSDRGVYHYHSTPACIHKNLSAKHSPVIGYAFDGFKIYGQLGEKGKKPNNLDKCNGHQDSGRGYHYHATTGFPYILGCYKGIAEPSNFDRNQRSKRIVIGGSQNSGQMQGRQGRREDPLRQACESDRLRFCPNIQPGPQLHQCMQANTRSFSRNCLNSIQNFGPPRRPPPGRRPPPRR